MFAELRQEMARLRADPPGLRFQRAHARRQAQERSHPGLEALKLLLALVMVAGGLLLWLLPVVPGFWLWAPGLALLASRAAWFARLLDRLELLAREVCWRLRLCRQPGLPPRLE